MPRRCGRRWRRELTTAVFRHAVPACLVAGALWIAAPQAAPANPIEEDCSSYSAFDDLALRTPMWLQLLVEKMAPKYNLDPNLVLAVIAVESNYSSKAVSPKNAQGLMQLIPATAERFGVKDSFNAKQNIQGGMKYLRWLLRYFDGDVTHALAGYNAGEGNVKKYKGVPPYRETKNYVKKVRRLYGCSVPSEQPEPEVQVTVSDMDRIRSLLLEVVSVDDPASMTPEALGLGGGGCAGQDGVLDVSALSQVSPGGAGAASCR